MKRQRGRNRKPGGGGGGGGGQSNNPNRAFESNGPENLKIRGNAQHVYERYQQLARDAFTSGDRVLAENYLQHAEHYFRVLRTLQPQRPVAEIVQRDAFASGFDIDFEDESGEQAVEMDGVAEAGETEGGDGMNAQAGGEQRRDRDDYRRDERGEGRRDREYRDDRPRDRDNRDRDNREFRDRDGNRDGGREGGRDRDRGDYRRDDREPRPDREFRGERNEGRGERSEARPEGQGGEGRREGRRDRFERRDRNRNRDDQPAGDPLAVVEPRAEALPSSAEAAPAPFAGDDSHMPAFLRQAPAAAEAEAAPAEKPKRAPRRKKTESFEDTPAD